MDVIMEEVVHINTNDLEKSSFDAWQEYVHTFSVKPKLYWNEKEKEFFETLCNSKTIVVWT